MSDESRGTGGSQLILDVDLPPGPVRVRVEGGSHRLAVPDPDGFLAAVAGIIPGGHVVLGRRVLGPAAHERWTAGLATATCELPATLEVPLLEVIALGRGAPVRAPAALFGSRRSRSAVADAVAAVRSLAGRIGLASWLAHPARSAPVHVQALADVARALAAAPDALVWRRPEWLGEAAAEEIAELVESERRRIDATAVEVALGRHGGPGV